jgi:hypothetical protein
MPIFTPGRRWQPAYSPFKQESFGNLVLENVEYALKGPLFGCRMCGNCMLQETAFICPMECPKGLRNGPCGGSTPEHCYVDKTRPCIWYKIFERSFKLGREEKLMEVLPPLDWEKVGTETWKDVVTCVRKNGAGKVLKSLVLNQGEDRWKTWDLVFRTVRQPDCKATTSTMRPVTPSLSQNWNGASKLVNLSWPAKLPRHSARPQKN